MAFSRIALLKVAGVSSLVLGTALGSTTPIAFGQASAPVPLDEPRLSDTTRLEESQRRLTTMGEAEANGQAGDDALEDVDLDTDLPVRIDGPVDAPERPETATAPQPPERRFDLFAGPEQARAPRLGARDVSPGRVRAAGRVADEVEETALSERDRPLFDPIGPVRPPSLTLSDSDTRSNTAVTGLRRSLPVLPDDPFAAEGIRAGSFLLFPALEQSIGASDNSSRSVDGEAGAFTDTVVSARLLSQWSRHEFELNGAASYRRNFEGPLPEEPRLDLDARLRLDIDRDWTATMRGALAFSRESAFSADPLTPVELRPDVLAYSASADLERNVGRAGLRLTTQAVREEREAIDGTTLTDDFTTYSAGLRAQYDMAPMLKPFVTASLGQRIFDDGADLLGRERDSLLPALRLGIGFDRGEKLSGEIAVGYASNIPDEDALETIGRPTIDARINWSPRRGTDVILSAATYFDPATDNLSTSTVYETSLGFRHRAGARLDFTGVLGASFRDQSLSGDETLFSAEAGVSYWIRRGLALTALARHERLNSELAASDYTANSVRVGVRVER